MHAHHADIDDDVLLAAKERARREGRSVGAVLSELARAGLIEQATRGDRSSDSFYGFAPFPPRGLAVTNTLVDELRDEEAE